MDEFELFKEEVVHIQNMINVELLGLRSEQDAFTRENLRFLERIEQIDFKIVDKTETLAAQTAATLKQTIDSF